MREELREGQKNESQMSLKTILFPDFGSCEIKNALVILAT